MPTMFIRFIRAYLVPAVPFIFATCAILTGFATAWGIKYYYAFNSEKADPTPIQISFGVTVVCVIAIVYYHYQSIYDRQADSLDSESTGRISGKERFYKLLSVQYQKGLIKNKEDIRLLLNSVCREYQSNYSLTPILEDYLIFIIDVEKEVKVKNVHTKWTLYPAMIQSQSETTPTAPQTITTANSFPSGSIINPASKTIDERLSKEEENLVKKHRFIRKIIDEENTEKPFSGIPDEERRLLRNINGFVNHIGDSAKREDLTAIKYNLQELSSVISTKNRIYQRSERMNKLSLAIAITTLIPAVFGVGKFLGIDFNRSEETKSNQAQIVKVEKVGVDESADANGTPEPKLKEDE